MKIRSRAIKWLLVATTAVVVVVVAVAALENLRGRWALSAYKKALEKSGQKLLPGEIARTPSEVETKNAATLSGIAKELRALGKECPLVVPGPEMMKLDPPGFARAMSQETQPRVIAAAIRSKEKALPPQTWEEFGRELERGAGLLEKARATLHEPIAEKLDPTKGGMDMGLPGEAFHILPWLISDCMYRLHMGDLELAKNDLVAVGALARCLEKPPALVRQTVAATIRLFATTSVWEALQVDGWTDAQLEAIQSSLGGEDSLQAAAVALEMERALIPLQYDMLRKSPEGRAAVMRMTGVNFIRLFADDNYEPPEPDEGQIWMVSHLWGLLWSDHDELYALKSLEPLVIASRNFVTDRNWAASSLRDWPKSAQPKGLEAWRHAFSAAIPRGDSASGVIQSAAKIDVERQLAITAVALKRFFVKHGRIPETLDGLVPDFLPAVPVDSMNGMPLRYQLTPGGGFSLYSVGSDGTDDGGDATPGRETRRGRSIHNGRDAVWPVPVTGHG